ncbi:DNA processing protein [Stella humosa]|uniref:DNA processing protein n=1 Tax=Stella humosa TaxID=94 RepID=A0A3N1KV20_9PROT|nr:DNA-processing protein DprA [Stella humosa]ROP81185.1 DNA processing protein [Stella humosa]BBK32531.1 DNA processing protein DprA [Stella humosa]
MVAPPHPPLSPGERIARWRLIRSERIGPLSVLGLVERHGSATAAIAALADEPRSPAIAPADAVAEEALRLEALGAGSLVWGDPDYPPALAAIADPPIVLATRGRRELLARPMVAIVGARNASGAGRRFAETLAGELGAAGFVVVSGMARGIDAAAHRGALTAGTVGVLATGIDVAYPNENRELQARVAEEGLLLTESVPGTGPRAENFPRRNRIVAGLALGVVVIEAAERSGSLITARLAGEQGREVFAVPGSPLDPRCKGTNGLIRNGAQLVESAADVIDQLRPQTAPVRRLAPVPTVRNPAPGGPDGAAALVLEQLGPTPLSVDELVRQCQLSNAAVAAILLEFELEGRIERHPGQKVSLR